MLWSLTVHLDDQVIASLVAMARPLLSDPDVVFLDQGCDHLNYLIDGCHVLRVPKTEGVARRLPVEVALLRSLGDLPVAVPAPEGPFHSSAYPFPFSVYPYIVGTPGDVAARVDRDQAARVLGRVLARLAARDADEVAGLGLSTEVDALALWREQAERDLAAFADIRALVPARALDIDALEPPPRLGLAHNDLWADHILVDQGGRVTAIIDWADAAIGDPAMDQAGLLAWFGEDFLAQALARGGLDTTQAERERTRYFALVTGIHMIALGRQLGRPTWVANGVKCLGHLGLVDARAGAALLAPTGVPG